MKKKKELDYFYEAYCFLYDHPMFQHKNEFEYEGKSCIYYDSMFDECLEVWVTKVNPKTHRIDDNEQLNTAEEVWLETGQWEWGLWEGSEAKEENKCRIPWHDTNLDCGGETFEIAIVKLAKLVYKYYGDYDHSYKEEP